MKLLENISKSQRARISVDIKILIPGDAKKDVIVLARRTRLLMVQLFYDKGKLTLEEAYAQLDGNLSPDKPETYYDDSGLLHIKEKDNGS